MEEIIAAILASPDFYLTFQESRQFNYILLNVDPFTLEQYNHICQQFFKKNPRSTLNFPIKKTSMDSFIIAWININKLIHQLHQCVQELWEEEKHHPMGADESLPITICFLLSHKQNLKALAQKLSLLMNIITSSSLAYHLVQLNAAAEYVIKIENEKFSSDDLLKSYEPLVNRADHRFHLFQTLYKAHQAYYDYLRSEIYNKLSTESPDIYDKFKSLPEQELIEAVIVELQDNQVISKALNQLIAKCICMQDLDYCLKLNKAPAYVLNLFNEKYMLLCETLRIQPNKFDVNLKSLHSYYLLPAYALYSIPSFIPLPIPTTESTFHQAALDVFNYFNPQPDNSSTLSAAAAAAALPKA